MCAESRKPMRFGIDMPACFDEPMTFDLKELAPATIAAIIDDLTELNPDDLRLPRLKECWDHLT